MTFTDIFYKHIMFRHSCGVCHYTNTQRPSDITLADFWGWEKNVPGMNDDDKGVSLVLLNTEKGELIFDKIRGKLDIKEVKVENCLQPNLQHPTEIHPRRMQFEILYSQKGFLAAFKRYGIEKKTIMERIRIYLKAIKKRISELI